MNRELTNAWRLGFVVFGLSVAMLLGCAGCATGGSGGTAALHDSGPVQGRDLGRGGATAGGVSSEDPSGNAADYSVYDARHPQQ